MAKSQVEAAKNSAPRFPPWHIFNRYKYMVSERRVVNVSAKCGGSEIAGNAAKKGAYGLQHGELASLELSIIIKDIMSPMYQETRA